MDYLIDCTECIDHTLIYVSEISPNNSFNPLDNDPKDLIFEFVGAYVGCIIGKAINKVLDKDNNNTYNKKQINNLSNNNNLVNIDEYIDTIVTNINDGDYIAHNEIYIDDKKIWSVTKLYDATTFEDNESCLGYKIDVYQDSINQTLPEFLVNFDFLTTTMDKYGFTLLTREEARQMKLPEGSGMFSELFNAMENEVKRHPEKGSDYKDALFMRDYEKDISFLNRFFIYKKTSTRNAEKLTKSLLEQLPEQEDIEQAGTMLAREAVKEAEEIVKPRAKKLSEKLKLQEATEVIEETIKPIKKTKTKKIKEAKIQEIPEPQEIIEIIPVTKKKTTRKKKAVELDIIEEK